jgi:hypothetical protein
MTTDITRQDFKQLEGRVDALEHKVNHDKTIKNQILKQTRRNGDDLAAIEPCLDRVEAERNLPQVVATSLREVLDERDRKR